MDDRNVYSIAALRVSDGTVLWAEPDPLGNSTIFSAHGLLILNGWGGIAALRATDGALLWRTSSAVFSFGEPALTVSGDVLYAVSDTWLYAVRAANGYVLWQLPMSADNSASINGARFSGPVVGGDTIYISTANGALIAVRASDGAVRWQVSLGLSPSSSGGSALSQQAYPVGIVAGQIYVETDTGLLRIRPSDGAIEKNPPDLPMNGSFLNTGTLDGTHYVVVAVGDSSSSTYTILGSDGKRLGRVSVEGPPGNILAFEKNVLYLDRGTILAIHTLDGVVLWEKTSDSPQFHGIGGIAAAPGYLLASLSGILDRCNVKGSYPPRLVALNSADGSIAWERNLIPTR